MRIVLLCLFISLLSCKTQKEEGVIMIAAASSLNGVMDDLTRQFEKDTGLLVKVSFGSSGKLTSQILEGAPFDIFLSADTLYPWNIYTSDKKVERPKVFTQGALICLSTSIPDLSENSLSSDQIEHIAIANPRLAPYGKAAIEYLESRDLQKVLSEKLVFGENVSQTNQFIFSGAADIGFTSKSILSEVSLSEISSWFEVDPQAHSSISHSAVLLNNKSDNAQKFYQYIFSEKGQNTFLKHGFGKISQP